MLVLSRKESERVKLGDSIVLTIVRVSGDRVRLGIEAPENMVILREELDESKVKSVLPNVVTADEVTPKEADINKAA